jgi:hypothetical protein
MKPISNIEAIDICPRAQIGLTGHLVTIPNIFNQTDFGNFFEHNKVNKTIQWLGGS